MTLVNTPYALEWLAATKFVLPVPGNDLVPRLRLVETLKSLVTTHKLILISAPAGSGKTTLLTSLASSLDNFPLAWFSIDPDDNDPVRFLQALVKSLRQLNSQIGETTLEQTRLKAPTSAGELRHLGSSLINSITNFMPSPFGLVLDDLHWINEPAIYQLLDFLLERLPAQMHLIVGTRYDPPLALARLRARGQLAEVRLPDLRFNSEETRFFLNAKSALELSEADLVLLQNRTEGWAAGIRMLASSLTRLTDPKDQHAFVTRLIETDNYLFDYLAEEVLDRQELAVRTFLLETSILSELTPEVCEAVTGREDAAALLEDLAKRNLFITTLNAHQRIYRYHDLFAEFLRERLRLETPQGLTYLYKCAAHAQTTPDKAIRYYLVAELWEDAAIAIEQAAPQTVAQGFLDNLFDWIAALPGDVQAAHPWIICYKAEIVCSRWQFEAAMQLFEQAFQGFERAGDKAGLAETGVYLEKLQRWKFGNGFGLHKLSEQALDTAVSLNTRIQALLLLALDDLVTDEWQKAGAKLDTILELAVDYPEPYILYRVANDFSSLFCGLPGAVQRLKRLENVIELQILKKRTHLHNTKLLVNALTCMIEGRWEQAVQNIQALYGTTATSSETSSSRVVIIGAILAMYNALHSDYAEAIQELEISTDSFRAPEVKTFMERWVIVYLYWQGRVWWEQGRLDKAQQVLDELNALKNDQEWPFAALARDLLKGLICTSQKLFSEAEQLFRQHLAKQNRVGFTIILNDIRLLIAYLNLQAQRASLALSELQVVLEEYKREERPGLLLWQGRPLVEPLLHLALEKGLEVKFVREVLKLMGTVDKPPQATAEETEIQPLRVPQTGETLTAREVEIIRLLAMRTSNREIAERLFITEQTVKTHVSNILRKLNITSRLEVASHAHKLKLM